MTPLRQTIVFFDIDGTLLHIRGAGRRAFTLALKDVFGLEDEIEYINFAGATDLQVLEDVTRNHDHTLRDGDAERFFVALEKAFRVTVNEGEATLFPGVRELIESLSSDDRYLLGLITGNIESCARMKLKRFHLHGHFFLGAFGHEHADRTEIARLAMTRARTGADRATGERCYLVGDTPSDVRAAHAIGATAVAVATGSFSQDALTEAGADHVFEDLGNLENVLNVLAVT